MTTQLPAGWKEITLGEIVELAQGVAINAKTNHVLSNEYEGLPLLKINNLLNNTVDQYANPNLVSKKAILEVDDVIFTRTGQVGWVFTGKKGILHNNSFKVIPSELLNKKFLYWFLKQQSIYDYVQKVASGSAQPDLNHDAFKTISISLPPLPEQVAIASLLSSFDDKIELLREQNKTLETLGQTIFQEWFGKYSVDNPESLPDGWRVGKLGEIVEFLNGFSFKSSNFSDKGKYRIVTIANVQDGSFVQQTKDGMDFIPDKMKDYCRLNTGDILLSLTGNVGRICHVVGDDYLLNQRVAKLNPIDEDDYGFVYLYFRQPTIIPLLESIASGTAQQNLSPIKTADQKIVIPSRQKIEKFGAIANFMVDKILHNLTEIQTLSTTRDVLLPRLMSGELRVEF